MKTSRATKVLLPVPAMPALYQVSSTSRSAILTSPIFRSTGSPRSSITGQPKMVQADRDHPADGGVQ